MGFSRVCEVCRSGHSVRRTLIGDFVFVSLCYAHVLSWEKQRISKRRDIRRGYRAWKEIAHRERVLDYLYAHYDNGTKY